MTDWLSELRACPICKNKVPYGEMIWLDGVCTCDACYRHRRAEYNGKEIHDDDTRRGNSHGR